VVAETDLPVTHAQGLHITAENLDYIFEVLENVARIRVSAGSQGRDVTHCDHQFMRREAVKKG